MLNGIGNLRGLKDIPGLHIIGEHFLPIRFQLMGVRGAKLSDIKTVESHVHALGLTWNDVSGKNNGQYAPFSWKNA